MTVQRSVAELLELRPQLPALVGEGWDAIAPEVEALLDRLARATGDEERQALYDDVITRLYVFPGVRRELAVRAGRRRGDDAVSRYAPRLEPVREEAAAAAPPPPPPGAAPPVAANGGGDEQTPAGVIERTPHLDVDADEPVAIGTRLEVTVWVDTQAARPGEGATTIVLPALSELQLRVWLIVSEHFSIVGEDTGVITVRAAQERSTEARFTVECVRAAAGAAGITASFAYGIRPAGSVSREVAVAQGGDAAAGRRPLPLAGVQVDASARQPDLVVQVLVDPDGDERHYVMRISSPRLADFAHGVTVPWRLPSVTKELVQGYFDAFTTADRGGRRAALVGAGRMLFRATPQAFQDAVWQLAAVTDPAPRSVFVVTSEPYVPWELMIPNDGPRALQALGVEFSVGRWVHPGHWSPAQAMPIVDSYVIAPTYRGSRALGFSTEEAQYVIDHFRGQRISPALLSTIDAALAQRGATLLHLICHGLNAPGGQVLDLDPDEQLREIQLEGLAGVVKAVDEHHPFVFINACEVGRPTPGLVGAGGFAAAFTRLGARCVIAPIWSVRDDVAGTVARAFYDAVRAEPSRPFASVLRDVRRRAYEGADPEDSFAAYCFYGDPLAAQVMP
jgi:hypothetical protein